MVSIKKPLEIIAREMNPTHDLDMVRYNERGIMENPFVVIYHFVKHPVRGGLVGGAIGSLVSYVSGESPQTGLVSGARIGVSLDLGQYILRFMYKHITTAIPPVYREIIKHFKEI